MSKVSIEQVIQQVKDLPALPHITYKVMELTDSPKTRAKELADLISQDQSLTVAVLKLANSAYYGYSRRIATVSEAILLLGFTAVRNLVVAASVHKFMAKELPGYDLAQGELWRHSLAAAIVARTLAQKSRYPNPEQVFVAGLLHDIGKVIICHYVADAFREIFYKVNQELMSFIEAEELVLGFHHAEIGGRVTAKWNLPKPLVEAISLHHNPGTASEDQKLTALVHLADALVMMLGIGLGGDGLSYPISGSAMEVLNLNEQDIEEMFGQMADVLANNEALQGI